MIDKIVFELNNIPICISSKYTSNHEIWIIVYCLGCIDNWSIGTETVCCIFQKPHVRFRYGHTVNNLDWTRLASSNWPMSRNGLASRTLRECGQKFTCNTVCMFGYCFNNSCVVYLLSIFTQIWCYLICVYGGKLWGTQKG